jgi:hypothetical protein
MLAVNFNFHRILRDVDANGIRLHGALANCYQTLTHSAVNWTALRELNILYLSWKSATRDGTSPLPASALRQSVGDWIPRFNRQAWAQFVSC